MFRKVWTEAKELVNGLLSTSITQERLKILHNFNSFFLFQRERVCGISHLSKTNWQQPSVKYLFSKIISKAFFINFLSDYIKHWLFSFSLGNEYFILWRKDIIFFPLLNEFCNYLSVHVTSYYRKSQAVFCFVLHSMGMLTISTLNWLLFTHWGSNSALFATEKGRKNRRVSCAIEKLNCVPLFFY